VPREPEPDDLARHFSGILPLRPGRAIDPRHDEFTPVEMVTNDALTFDVILPIRRTLVVCEDSKDPFLRME
jgi:hypothetical protein